jgi:hypothetical protein
MSRAFARLAAGRIARAPIRSCLAAQRELEDM